VLGGHRADHHVGSVGPHALEVGQTGEVDEMRRRREAQLHHRDEAVAAGERPRVVAQIGEHGDCISDGFRTVISKGTGYHGILPGAVPYPEWSRSLVRRRLSFFLRGEFW